MPSKYTSRRQLLLSAGGLVTALTAGSLAAYRMDRQYDNQANDGIPDDIKRSELVHTALTDLYGPDQFSGFGVNRRELLIDARYIGNASISAETKTSLARRFATNGIHLHWLDYPESYDRTWFEQTYGYQVERILPPYRSFYRHHIEGFLKNIALQVIVIPSDTPDLASIYSVSREIEFNGVSFGNRCIVTATESSQSEAMLVLHEIGHLVLCHDFSEDNTGVMGPTPQRVDLTATEWSQFQNGLSNVRDTTGVDITFRRCMLEESAADIGYQVESQVDRFSWGSLGR